MITRMDSQTKKANGIINKGGMKMSKQSINFVYYWGTGDRKLAWSGTPWGLFSALSKNAEVTDIPLQYTRKYVDFFNARVLKHNDFGIGFTKMGERQLKKLDIADGPLLAFSEFNTPYLDRTYLYQDLTVDFLMRLKETSPDLLEFTPLTQDISASTINKRSKLTQHVNENCKGIFTMSKWLANDLINSGISPNKVHHVGGGCSPDVSLIDPSQKCGNKFLFIGKHWECKNGPLVVKAFCQLLSRRKDIQLYVAGPNECPKEISELPSNFKNSVHFLGRISYSEVAKYLNLCDYYVMPSRFDAYGLVFVEALVFGLPCIGRNAFAMPEFIDGKNGLLINDNSADELADCMDRLMSDHSFVENVQSRKDVFLEQYSWNTVAKRMINVFRNDRFSV